MKIMEEKSPIDYSGKAVVAHEKLHVSKQIAVWGDSLNEKIWISFEQSLMRKKPGLNYDYETVSSAQSLQMLGVEEARALRDKLTEALDARQKQNPDPAVLQHPKICPVDSGTCGGPVIEP